MANAAYWQSPTVLAHTGAVTQALMHMFIGVFFYDCILSAPFDWSILSGKRQIRWVHAAYFGSKLSLLAYCAAGLAVTWVQSEIDCRAAFHAIETCMGLLVFCSSVLLAFRTICVYHGREQRIVKAVVTLGAAGLLAVWMQGVRDVTAAWTTAAHTPYSTGMCIIAEMRYGYWIKYVVTIVFDAAILVMTTVGVARAAGASRVGMVLVQQGIVYFILTLLANLIITVITLLQLSDAMSLAVAMPQSVICVICSCRLYRNLADGSSMRSANNSMSGGGGVVELDANGDALPTSAHSSAGGCTKRRFSRFFRTPATSRYPSQNGGGRMPSFVSASSGARTPAKEREPATPGAGAGNVARLGYFDVAAAPPTQQTSSISSSHDPVDFFSMLQETRQRQLSGQTSPTTPSITFGGGLSPLSSPVRAARALPSVAPIKVNIEEEKRTEYM